MSDRNKFLEGIAQSAAWDAIKWLLGQAFKYWYLVLLVSGLFTDWDFLDLVPALGLFFAFVGYGFMLFGVGSFLWIVSKWVYESVRFRSDKPKLFLAEGYNQIIEHKGRKIDVAIMPISNKPEMNSINSNVYNVYARLVFSNRKNGHLANLDYAYLIKNPAEHLFSVASQRVDFYANDVFYLPVVYKWEDEEEVYVYDSSKPMGFSRLGKLPIIFSVVLLGENIKTSRPTVYMIVPNSHGTKGFWIRKI